MNPRSGENPPLISNSRSQSWRAVRSQEGHSRECAFSSLIRSGWTTRLTSSPPWGGIRWLVEAVKSLNLPGPFRFLLDYCCLDYFSRRRDCDGRARADAERTYPARLLLRRTLYKVQFESVSSRGRCNSDAFASVT